MSVSAVRNMALWWKRFRYRCGYGVHSPFAFNFITGVIFERGEYYAYRKLDAACGKSRLFWRRSHQCTCWHFLFRLANFVRPDYFLADSTCSAQEAAYLSEGSRKTEWGSHLCLDTVSGKSILMFAAANEARLPELLKEIRENAAPTSALLLRTDGAELRERCSAIIQSSADCGVSFDLYDYLLVFFDLNLYKQHYLINFFD